MIPLPIQAPPDMTMQSMVRALFERERITSIFYFCGNSREDCEFLMGLTYDVEVAGMSDMLGPLTPGLGRVNWYEEGMPRRCDLYIDCWGPDSPLPHYVDNLIPRGVRFILTKCEPRELPAFSLACSEGLWNLFSLGDLHHPGEREGGEG